MRPRLKHRGFQEIQNHTKNHEASQILVVHYAVYHLVMFIIARDGPCYPVKQLAEAS